MATRPDCRRRTARLRCDTLEPRVTPAADPVLDFGAGFTPDRLPGGIPDGYLGGDLLLTDGRYQSRAVFAPTRVDVRSFQTSFLFHLGPTIGPPPPSKSLGDGFTFALTGDDRQAIQTAGGGAGGGLGYQGLTDSVAVKFDLVDNAGEGAGSVGVFTGGAAPTTPAASVAATGIDLHNGHSYRADVAYDGTTLTLTLTDLTVPAPAPTWTHAFAVDIPAAVAGDTAYAGFTGGTAELTARIAIDSWTYTEGAPEPLANRPPIVTTPAWASFGSPGSAILSIGATDDADLDNLTYTWEVVSAPAGANPQIRPMGGPSASVSLDRAGRHTFRVTVTDAEGLSATSEVSYSDPLFVTDFQVSAGTQTIRAGEPVQFQTLVRDASGTLTAENLGATWRVVSGPGTIDYRGQYTAPSGASGSVTVEAEIQAISGGHYFRRTARTTVTVGGFGGVDLTENGSAEMTGGFLRLTDGPHQAGSAFAAEPLDVRGFRTSFWFRVGPQPGFRYGDGLTFVLQNAGATAVGRAGGGLGYEGIGSSVAVKFDLVNNAGEGPQSVGMYAGGAAPTAPADRLPAPPPGNGSGGVVLNEGHVFRADLTYAAGMLTLRLWDTVTGHGFGREYPVNIPAAVGGDTAYAGFTAGTGEFFVPIDVLQWTYTPADNPEPPPTTDGDGAPSLAVEMTINTSTITTVAGNGSVGYSGDGGPAAGAQLNSPSGVAVDAAGNLFIADLNNQRVRRVDAATGVITTVAGTGVPDHNGDGIPATAANLGYPLGVAVDAAGNLFITETGNNRIRKMDAASGVITTVAGTGGPGYSGDGGQATSASVGFPHAVAVDAAGNLYIADTNNNRVRRVDAVTGVITSIAGTGEDGYAGDGGPATGALLSTPFGVAVDAAGNLFIADQHNNRVRRVDAASGVISTVAGTGVGGYAGDGGPAAGAYLLSPTAVAVDAAGNLFISDSHNMRVRRVDAATGVISTVAGTGVTGYGGDGGPATSAVLDYPFGLAVDPAGNLFFADTGNDRIRKVAAATVREGDPAAYTFTVTNTSSASTDPVTVTKVLDTLLGDLTAAARAANGGEDIVLAPGQSFAFPYGAGPQDAGPVTGTMTVAGHDDEGIPATATATHTLTVTDVPPAVDVDVDVTAGTGIITTVAGTGTIGFAGDGGLAAEADLWGAQGVAADAAGNLFIADVSNHRVRRVDAASGVITTVAGTGVQGFSGDGGPATTASLSYPTSVTLDAAGHLYVGDGGNYRVRRVDAATGVITTVAGNGTYSYGGDGGPATSASLSSPSGVAVDGAGNLYFADTYNSRVRKVDAASGVITTVAGTGTPGYAGDGGPAAAAPLRFPNGVAVDAAGNLFIADADGQRVRRVDAATGVITTVAGTGVQGFSGDGGPAATTPLYAPAGVTVDAWGNVFIADTNSHRVRRVDEETGVITTVAGSGAEGYGGDGGPATGASLRYPRGLAVDALGNLFIADVGNNRIRRVVAATVREGSSTAYTLTIRNTSPATTDPVTVTAVGDNMLGDLTAAARAANGGADIVLSPGGRFTFTATSPALGSGTVVVEVTVTAHDNEGTVATASDTEMLTVS